MSILQLMPVSSNKSYVPYPTCVDSTGVSSLMGNVQIIKDYTKLLWGLRGLRGYPTRSKVILYKNLHGFQVHKECLVGEGGAKSDSRGLFAALNHQYKTSKEESRVRVGDGAGLALPNNPEVSEVLSSPPEHSRVQGIPYYCTTGHGKGMTVILGSHQGRTIAGLHDLGGC